MPPQRGPIVRKPAKKKKVVRKKASKPGVVSPAPGSSWGTSEATPRPKYDWGDGKGKVHTRPKQERSRSTTPTARPGPYTDAERKKVKRHKRKSSYGKALQEARKHGSKRSRGSVQLGEGATGKSDEAFERAKAYVRRQYVEEFGTDDKGQPKSPLYQRGTTVPPDLSHTVSLKDIQKRKKERQAQRIAPVLTALEQTTRPLHGAAAGTRAAIKGKNVPKAVVKGVKNEDKSTFSDVLKDVGADKIPVVGKPATAAAGFALDVALDPTTYVTGGLSTGARKAALKAAKNAEKKATPTPKREPTTSKETRRAAERSTGGGADAPSLAERAATRAAAKKKRKARGVSVRFAGTEVPGVRRATAKAGRGVKKATDKPKVVRKAKEKVRHVAADVNPSVVPDNISRASYREVRRATRTARSTTAREVAKTKEKAVAVRKAVEKADQEILDAIESGSLRKLSPEKRAVAKRLQDQFKHARRLERRAGIAVKERKGYVPHALKEPLEKGEGIQSVGAKTIKPSFAKGRKEQRSLAEIRKTDPEKYSEDAALLYANRMIESHVASNKAGLNRRLLDMGRRVRKGDEVRIGEGEKVFRVVGSDIKPVEKAELQRFLDTGDGGKGGQYVILNEQTVDRAVKNVIPASERTAIGKGFDKVQGGWKWLATVPNPGFHVRNLVGDAGNAYLAENAGKVAVNVARSAKTLKRIGKQEEQLRKALPGAKTELKGKGVKVGGKKVSYDELIREAEGVGAVRSGFISRELPELASGKTGAKKAGRLKRATSGKVARPARSLSRFLKDREDLFRLATYIGARNRGLSPEKAAERASKFHFDYADLTQLERTVLRRVAPFYTFSARNIPLQLTSYFAKPGKYAQYQKIREEAAKAFGINLDEYEQNLTEYEQRAAGVPIKHKGAEFTLSFGPSGLPLTDLNELPTGVNPTEWADEWFQRAVSLMSPGIKTPLELGMNYSFFFRDQLERDEGPLVPAPAMVAKMPEAIRKQLGIVADFVDKRTGKKGWGWPAKLDYLATTVSPGPIGAAKRLNTPSSRPGQTTLNKAVGYAGLRVTPVDAASAKIGRIYDEKAKLAKKRAALNQRGITAENPTAEWRKVSDEISRMEDEINRLREKRGDKIISKRGRPKVVKGFDFSAGKKEFDFDSGSSGDFDFD